MKNSKNLLLGVLVCLFSTIGNAQEITGVVKSKTTTLYFENFAVSNSFFNGEIHSNFSGSKYTFNLKSDTKEWSGVIQDKFSKFKVDLNSPIGKIQGEIDRAPNHTNDLWSIKIGGKTLSGKVTHNMMGTNDTYELKYGDQDIIGEIYSKGTGLVYDLKFGAKNITGTMKYNISTVKHTYNLTAKNLSEEEGNVYLFIECVKLMNEYINDIEEFQHGKH